jgi:serine/threonine protein kinase
MRMRQSQLFIEGLCSILYAHHMMDDSFIRHFLEIRIGGRYQICKRIGSGTFGKVYIGKIRRQRYSEISFVTD